MKMSVSDSDQGNVNCEEFYWGGKLSSAPPNPDALLALAV